MKKLAYGVGLIAVVVISFWMGWWRHVGENAVVSGLAQGQMHLAAARAIREGKTSDALKLMELSVLSSVATLRAPSASIPKEYSAQAARFLSAADAYQTKYQYPEAKNLSEQNE